LQFASQVVQLGYFRYSRSGKILLHVNYFEITQILQPAFQRRHK